MAKKIEVALTLDSRNFDRQITQSEAKVDKFSKNSSAGIGKVGAAFAALGGATLIKSIVQIGQTFQDLQTSLNFVTGGAQQGADAFDNLTKLATQTQFGVEELVQTFIRLKGAGIEPTNDLLLTFADTASLAQDQLGVLNSLTELFARAATKGKIELEDFNKIAERGVDVFRPLTKEFNLTIDEIKKLAETPEGQEQLFRGIEKALDDTYGGALQEKLNNSSAAFSNLEIAARRLANTTFKELGLNSTKAIKDLTDAINRLADNGETLRKVFVGLATVIAFFLNPFAKIGAVVGVVSRGFAAILGKAGPLVKVFKQLTTNASNFINVFKSRAAAFFGFGTQTAKNSKTLGTLNKTIDEGTNRALAYGSAVGAAVLATKMLNDESAAFVGPPLPPGFVRPTPPIPPETPTVVKDTRTALQKYKDMLDDVIPSASSFEEQLVVLNDTLGDPKTVGQISDYESALNTLKQAFNVNEEFDEFKESFEDVDTIEEYNTKLTALTGLLNAGKISAKEFADAKEDLDERLGDNQSLLDFIATLNTATDTLADDLAVSLMEGKNVLDDFKNFFKTLVQQLIADAIKMLFIIPILQAVGFSVGPTGAIAGLSGSGLLGNLGFKQTGIGGGNLMPNRPVLVGESGPEVFYPASSGRLSPNNMGTQVTYNINAVDAPSFQALVASDPEFIYSVTRAGARRLPGAT